MLTNFRFIILLLTIALVYLLWRMWGRLGIENAVLNSTIGTPGNGSTTPPATTGGGTGGDQLPVPQGGDLSGNPLGLDPCTNGDLDFILGNVFYNGELITQRTNGDIYAGDTPICHDYGRYATSSTSPDHFLTGSIFM